MKDLVGKICPCIFFNPRYNEDGDIKSGCTVAGSEGADDYYLEFYNKIVDEDKCDKCCLNADEDDFSIFDECKIKEYYNCCPVRDSLKRQMISCEGELNE